MSFPPSGNVPTLPHSGAFINSIRDGSRALRQAAQIAIEPESIGRLLCSPAFTSSFKRVTTQHGLAFPLHFHSVLSELNFISVLGLLNFGSGYRVPLHAATGRGAWDTTRALVLSLYLTSSVGDEDDWLSARGMQAIGEPKVAELMCVSQHVERPHASIPGVTVGELGGPMHDIVKLITLTLNETGEILVSSGYPNLGSFVLEALQESRHARYRDNINAGAEIVLERLVRAIPAFRDMAIVDDKPVYCFKKALFLIHAINLRFSNASPPPFPVPPTSHIPIFADNVVPSLLVHLGVIDLSASSHSLSSFFSGDSTGHNERLASLLAATPTPTPKFQPKTKEPLKDGPVLSSDQAYILRAAAIDACEMIVEVARSLDTVSSEGESLPWIREISLPELDMWIWAVAKDRPDFRLLTRFLQRNTVYF